MDLQYKFIQLIISGQLDKVKKMIMEEHPDMHYDYYWGIYCACAEGHEEIAKWLTEIVMDRVTGYELDYNRYIYIACEKKRDNIVRWLIKTYKNRLKKINCK